jgi:DNA-binding helix-hairpin-helix protein with protein kinase domain
MLAPPSLSVAAVQPRAVPSSYRLRRAISRALYAAGLIVLLLVVSRTVEMVGLLAVGALAIVAKVLGTNPEWERERAARKAAFNSASHQWKGLVDAWEKERRTMTDTFRAKRQELEKLLAEHKELPERMRREKESLYRHREEHQRRAFLDRHFIRGAQLSGIGTGLKATLISQGFETAADITSAVLNVSGIGQARYMTLIAWRHSVEQQFRFNPNQGVNQADVALLEHKIAMRRTEIERALVQGRSALEQLRRRAEHLNAVASTRFEAAAKQYAQAKADHSIV